MKAPSRSFFLLLPAAAAAALLVAACGGGGDGTPASTTVSGDVVKGPVSGANVCAFAIVNGAKGTQLKCVTSGNTGAYTMELDYRGDVIIEATGGTYTDEATGNPATLADPMRVVIQAQGGSTVGVVTPLTTVAYSIASQGTVSATTFNAAAASVATQFQLNGVNIATTLPSVSGAVNGYGQILRAVSQYVANGGTLATFLSYADPTAFQAALATAYATINGTTITFTLNNTPPSTGGTGGSSANSCGISVSGSGTVTTGGQTVPFTLPPTKVCVTGIPAASCSAGNAQLQNLAAAGAVPGTGYSINYNYSYAPGNCDGAIAVVNYTQ